MAATSKIYLKSYDEYREFKKWCLEQPDIKDKFGKASSLIDYLFIWWDDPKAWEEGKPHPVMEAPNHVDAYLIRKCPLEYVQKELMVNYGYWSQDLIKEYYNDVKNWKGKGKSPYWAKLEDFITLEDGTMTIKGLKKSDYEKIKEGKIL